jgi:Domain of unknown function (DUF4258)
LGPQNSSPLASLVHLRMTQVPIAHLRLLIRTLNYAVSTRAADELEDDNLTILDLENVVLSGQIIERQRDRNTGETKYVIQGGTLDGTAAEVIAKVGYSGRLFVITVYVV